MGEHWFQREVLLGRFFGGVLLLAATCSRTSAHKCQTERHVFWYEAYFRNSFDI